MTARPRSLRDTMPHTAAIVDELRQVLGAAVVDRALRDAARGGRAFYAAEIGPAGELLQFGAPADGRRARIEGGQLVRDGYP